MSAPKVRLYIRVALPDGTRPFIDPVYSGNQKLKEGWAVYEDQPQRFEDFTYYVRYLKDGKRVYERLGSDAQQALAARKRLEVRLQATAEGIQLSPAEPAVERDSPATPGRTLLDCIASYIEETATHKSKKTLAAYTETLLSFTQSLDSKRKDVPAWKRDGAAEPSLQDYLDRPTLLSSQVQQKTIESVSRDEMLRYVSFLRDRGNSPRTIANRIEYAQIFLHHFGLPSILKGKDKPKYTTKKVRAYNGTELVAMFEQATVDEADLLHFLLCTGTREQEAQFACWPDLDLVAKMYRVTEHRDLGFTPKDKEEGEIPLPDVLVDRLKARRARYPKARLVFPTGDGRPNGHALRIIKRLALRAGVNCGHCVNKGGKSCATHPVCRNVFLHKLRKTYATTLHRNGVPARTIMGFLRHSDLTTTLRYLADGDDEQTRARINRTFGAFVSPDAVNVNAPVVTL